MVVRVACIGVVAVLGVLCIGLLEVDCVGVVEILLLGAVFVMEVVEGVDLVVGCVVRLVLWCVNGRGYFLCCFSLNLVEMNGLSVGGFLFGMVIWEDVFWTWWLLRSLWWRLWMWCKCGFLSFFGVAVWGI